MMSVRGDGLSTKYICNITQMKIYGRFWQFLLPKEVSIALAAEDLALVCKQWRF